ncbi:MAG: 3-hydroxyacyl-ACP dehydratase FabZ family protein [Dissulfurispiraceae bacterium]
MRFLLIDHILEWKAGESMKGIKNITMSEDFLEFHFPKNPIMPGVLLLEALSQLTGWLEAASSDFKSWFLLNKVYKSSFYGFAFPGDQVVLEVRSEAQSPFETKVYKGIGMVNGKKKIVVEYAGDIISLDEIEDSEEQRRFFQLLTREFTP